MKENRGDQIFLIINTTLILIVTLLIVYPLYFTIIASVSEPSRVALGEVTLLPKGFTLMGYQNVLKNGNVWRGYGNTIIYTVFGTLYNLVLTIPAAYVLSKKYLPWRNLLSWFFFITMYLSGGMIPTYLVIKQLGLLNTPWVMIIGVGVSCYNLIVTRQYFSAMIPEELYEAARIDGAGEWRTFASVAMPLASSIIAVMALYYGVGHWNSYYNALIYITDRKLYPLQLVLRSILIENETALQAAIDTGDVEGIAAAPQHAYMAQIMKYALIFISSAPMLAAYPFVQKYFVKGVMIGSVKG